MVGPSRYREENFLDRMDGKKREARSQESEFRRKREEILTTDPAPPGFL